VAAVPECGPGAIPWQNLISRRRGGDRSHRATGVPPFARVRAAGLGRTRRAAVTHDGTPGRNGRKATWSPAIGALAEAPAGPVVSDPQSWAVPECKLRTNHPLSRLQKEKRRCKPL
jgi:hypothetical protein